MSNTLIGHVVSLDLDEFTNTINTTKIMIATEATVIMTFGDKFKVSGQY